jgi:hypothetical protein
MKKALKKGIVVVLAILLLTGCASLEKMKKNANLIQYKVVPEVLETHAGKVDVGISGNFPVKYFIKNATMLVTPVLTYAEGEYPLPVINLQGEKISANNKVLNTVRISHFRIPCVNQT